MKKIIMIDVPKNKYLYTVVLGDLSEEGKLQNANHEIIELSELIYDFQKYQTKRYKKDNTILFDHIVQEWIKLKLV